MNHNSKNERTEINPKKFNGFDYYTHSQTKSYAPFEVAYVEYKQLEILVGTENRRPWITLLIDKSTKRILASDLRIDPPSIVSILMAIRDCVKNHSRLPNTLVIHSGKEFRSMDFQTLAAKYSMTIQMLPPEKIFYLSDERMMSKLDLDIKNKLSSISHGITNVTTTLTIEELKNELQRLLITYDNTKQLALNDMSPKEAFQNQIYEVRKPVIFDESFKIMTCVSPSPRRGTAILIPGKGIKINDIYYWSEELETLDKQQVTVKYDPQDLSIAYTYIENKWIRLSAL